MKDQIDVLEKNNEQMRNEYNDKIKNLEKSINDKIKNLEKNNEQMRKRICMIIIRCSNSISN